MNTATKRTRDGLAATALVVAGAISVGVHAGLAPEHLSEWPPLGAAFVAAAAAGATLITLLAVRPASPWPPRLLATLLASLVVAFVLTRLLALPPLDPEREPPDLLGVATTAVEAAGLLLALHLGRPASRARLSLPVSTGGTA